MRRFSVSSQDATATTTATAPPLHEREAQG